jgi:hypothetical protein
MTASRPGFARLLTISAIIFLASCGGGGGDGGATMPVGSGQAWIIPATEVVDGGPGKDGIPSIDAPVFEPVMDDTVMLPGDIVVGLFHEGVYQAYPHKILNWHEVVNDSVQSNSFVLSYCPLTGSALAWDVDDGSGNPEFGVSGLLYNSNLILYDRDTNSRWSQMLELSVWGARVREIPARIHVIETTWETWVAMYPDSWVLTRNTGHQRNYNLYPYGNYFRDENLLFPVSNLDNRLHPKERVIGVRSATASKVYQLAGFGLTTQTINEQFDGQPIVIVGNSVGNFAAIFGREMLDGTVLTFSPLEDQFPSVMQDNEGTHWDLFGTAISGPRVGTQLTTTNSYTAMWFAWATFFDNTEIHFN